MAKRKDETETKEEAEVLEPAPDVTEEPQVSTSRAKKDVYAVLDSNGKEVRRVDTEEEAKALAKVYQGRCKAL